MDNGRSSLNSSEFHEPLVWIQDFTNHTVSVIDSVSKKKLLTLGTPGTAGNGTGLPNETGDRNASLQFGNVADAWVWNNTAYISDGDGGT